MAGVSCISTPPTIGGEDPTLGLVEDWAELASCTDGLPEGRGLTNAWGQWPAHAAMLGDTMCCFPIIAVLSKFWFDNSLLLSCSKESEWHLVAETV